jgi:hypothetical protein
LKYHGKPRVERRSVYGTAAAKMSMGREELAGGTKSLLGLVVHSTWPEQDEERRASVGCGLFAVFYMISAYPA